LNFEIQSNTGLNPIKPIIHETNTTHPNTELVPLSFYQQELKKRLPESVFKRTPARALHLVGFILLNSTLVFLITENQLPWYLKLIAAVLIGQFNAGLAFVAHETLHGSIVKSRFFQNFIGSVGFAPFLVSATYWRFWHNTLHHGNTQLIYKDPDAFPTLSVYKRSKFMRAVFELAPGSKNPLSFFYLFYWFSFQSILNQSFMRFKNKMWANMDHNRVTIEFSVVALIALSYVYWVGFNFNLLWLVIIPMAVQNYVILSYILTNHNISPLTKINDPLENSLTVTTNPLCDFFDLNFGYHVEHHLFPRVSGKHAKKIHLLLKEMYPEKYKFMPKWKALRYLYATPRLYKSSNELVCPKTLKTYPTINCQSSLPQ
jgi:fatty acid desaturase